MLRPGFIILEGWENRFNVTPLLGGWVAWSAWDDGGDVWGWGFVSRLRGSIHLGRAPGDPSLPPGGCRGCQRLNLTYCQLWAGTNEPWSQPGLFCLKHNRCQLRQLQKCLVKQVLFRVITWTQILHVHIFPAFSWMRSTLKLFLLSRQIVPSSIFLVSNYEVQVLVSIHHSI